jgi:hypothetical protein
MKLQKLNHDLTYYLQLKITAKDATTKNYLAFFSKNAKKNLEFLVYDKTKTRLTFEVLVAKLYSKHVAKISFKLVRL